VTKKGTYLRIFGATKPPRLLPKFIPDKLVLQLDIFHFGTERFRRHDLHNVIERHYSARKYKWPYKNEEWQEEELYRRAASLEELAVRMSSGIKGATDKKKEYDDKQKKEEEGRKKEAELEQMRNEKKEATKRVEAH
jgi:Mg-chelatase subunit ChlI